MTDTVDIKERGGEVFLDTSLYSLKIDKNRIVYLKKKEDSIYKSIGEELPQGLSIDEKKKYIFALFTAIEKRRKELIEEKQMQGSQSREYD